jgi:D-alanyl-D-alanine carboxypeptidase, serine-type, PBP4 family
MLFHKIIFLFVIPLLSLCAEEAPKPLPKEIVDVMHLDKYRHSSWGVFMKDSQTGDVVFDVRSDEMFLPASTTKLFSVAALLQEYGDDYRFKTPVYAVGEIKEGRLEGNLVLVAQGDLTFGGRQEGPDKIAFTKLDHIIANNVPGVILTPQDPLLAFKGLAKQIKEKGITEVDGDILIDDRLFETTTKREMILSPMIVNENLIDFTINPGDAGKGAAVVWRPQVEGYTVTNELVTGDKDSATDIQISADESGQNIVLKGSVPVGEKDLVRTFSVRDPNHLARAAFVDALRGEGITVKSKEGGKAELPSEAFFSKNQPLAVWVSPPLTEYAQLILKVSHNLGANLVPLLLAVRKGEKTFDQGMRVLGKFVTDEVHISKDAFVFIDGAGGDENRVTPKAEVQLLDYMSRKPAKSFQRYMNSLPILGVDGSLEDFGKKSSGAGKVYAKTGTGVAFNLSTNEFFLTTQTLGGYIKGKNGHLFAFMLTVNNGKMPAINDIFAIFEDLSQIASHMYDSTN